MGDRGHRCAYPLPTKWKAAQDKGPAPSIQASLSGRAGVRRRRTSGLRSRIRTSLPWGRDVAAVNEPRLFAFGDDSTYAALKIADPQWNAIEAYERDFGLPVYYMLYHPPAMPYETLVPLVGGLPIIPEVVSGARVLPAADLRTALAGVTKATPTYGDLKSTTPLPYSSTATPPGWAVEDFIANLAIDCKVGHVAKNERDARLERIFYRRNGPISAAIAVTFDAPLSADLDG